MADKQWEPAPGPKQSEFDTLNTQVQGIADHIANLVKQTTQTLITDSAGMVDINTSKKPIVGVQVIKTSDSSACRAIQIRCRDYQGTLQYKYLIQDWSNGDIVASTGITAYVTYIDINLS